MIQFFRSVPSECPQKFFCSSLSTSSRALTSLLAILSDATKRISLGLGLDPNRHDLAGSWLTSHTCCAGTSAAIWSGLMLRIVQPLERFEMKDAKDSYRDEATDQAKAEDGATHV